MGEISYTKESDKFFPFTEELKSNKFYFIKLYYLNRIKTIDKTYDAEYSNSTSNTINDIYQRLDNLTATHEEGISFDLKKQTKFIPLVLLKCF